MPSVEDEPSLVSAVSELAVPSAPLVELSLPGPAVSESPERVDELLLVAVVEGGVVLTPSLLVPLPEVPLLPLLLGCGALVPLGDVVLLGPGGLTALEVVLGEVTGPDPDSVEHDATTGERKRHTAAERKGDKRILVMSKLPTNLER